MHWRLLFALLLLTTCVGGASAAVNEEAVKREDAKLLTHLERAWNLEIGRDPTLATALGTGSPRDSWTPISDERDAEDERLARKELQQLPTIVDVGALSPNGRTNYQVYEEILRDRIRAVDYRRQTYFFTRNTSDPYLEIPQTLISSHRIETVADARAYIARLRGLSKILDDALAGTVSRERRGIVLPAFNFEDIARNSRQLVAGRPCDDGPTDQSFWADFQHKLAAKALPDDVRNALLADARRALLESVCPAYKSFAARISAMGEGRTSVEGLWSLPNGEALYRTAIRLHTSLDVNLEELHQTGLREVGRLEAELSKVAERVEYKGSVTSFLGWMRKDSRFQLPQSEEGRQRYLELTRSVVARTQSRLPELFSKIPARPLEVRAVEAAREDSLGSAAFYEPPPGGVGPGIYYIGLADMARRPTWEIEATTYHEAIPGHHFQVSMANELRDLPELRRRYRNNAYQEGWALYAESLGQALGGYSDDYSLAARYQLELLRAVRVVVETGFHYKRWTWEQGAAYLAAHQGMSPEIARKEMTRYMVWPGQGVSYKVGELELRRLRSNAESSLGTRFDARAFHSAILEGGTLPFTLLEQRVNAWIESSRTSSRE